MTLKKRGETNHRHIPQLQAALSAATLVLTCAFAAPAMAQQDKMMPMATPSQADAIVLGTGALPGATAQEAWHRQYGSDFVRNVTVATLTPFLPAKGKDTGAAVIVAPGGGFRTLSMSNEGWDVAKALAAKGVAAFVLKYRLNPTPVADGGYGLIDSWKSAKRPVEFHLFEQGGHGFGMYPKTTTSTGWFDSFTRWLAMHGYLKARS